MEVVVGHLVVGSSSLSLGDFNGTIGEGHVKVHVYELWRAVGDELGLPSCHHVLFLLGLAQFDVLPGLASI